MTMTDFVLRPATPDDCVEIDRLIRELADYEKLAHQMQGTPEKLRAALFGPRPAAEAVMAERGGRAVGFALFFTTYSTFLSKPGLYLEDLFVEPAHRGAGIGKALLTHLAGLAVERGCGRFEWRVLDWNEPSIRFYESIGGRILPEWELVRMTEPEFAALAARRPG
ncbi:MAG: GNAT family N-acetyltransferase [Betaproteobacteria bacterium]|nr:GNAT family N-acetyltransferase [Betaproteobacteria bacterium]